MYEKLLMPSINDSQKQKTLQAVVHLNLVVEGTAHPNRPQSSKGGNQEITGTSLGSLSSKYESNGNPAVIARNKGDIGGASYGTYQLSTSSGHAQSFASSYGGALKGKKAGTSAFDQAWKAEAKKNPAKFKEAQHKYIQNKHYQPAANKFKSITGINLDKMPKAVLDMIWSVGVQHGAGGASSIFKNAGIKAGMSAATIISKVYTERMKVNKYFPSSSKGIKSGVLNRFKSEFSAAMKMLGR
jgi:hypothetical protein